MFYLTILYNPYSIIYIVRILAFPIRIQF